jgi:hypothetical protein
MNCNKTFLSEISSSIDQIRHIHDYFGTRPYKIFIITKEWSEGEQNFGQLIERSKLELLPNPKIEKYNDISGRWEPFGEAYDGQIRLSEISSTYSMEQLNPVIMAYQQKEVLIEFNNNHKVIMTIEHITYNTYKSPGWMITGKVREIL